MRCLPLLPVSLAGILILLLVTSTCVVSASSAHISHGIIYPTEKEDTHSSNNSNKIDCSKSCFISRGGGQSIDNDDVALSNADKIIMEFFDNIPDVKKSRKFHIQGWRWHTMSLLRDCRRLENLALRIKENNYLESFDYQNSNDGDEKGNPLNKAVFHVVDFNMKGLHRIESDLFYPWLRLKLATATSSGSDRNGDVTIVDEDVASAFSVVIDQMDAIRQSISQYGIAVKEQVKIASRASTNESKRLKAIDRIGQLSASMSSKTQTLLELEEKLIVPAVAYFVSDSEQKSFNNKVIRKLGVFDSRLHLVGMHDAVWEHVDKSERDKFQEAIPYIPRLMLPRWRTNLYDPQAGILAEQSS